MGLKKHKLEGMICWPASLMTGLHGPSSGDVKNHKKVSYSSPCVIGGSRDDLLTTAGWLLSIPFQTLRGYRLMLCVSGISSA